MSVFLEWFPTGRPPTRRMLDTLDAMTAVYVASGGPLQVGDEQLTNGVAARLAVSPHEALLRLTAASDWHHMTMVEPWYLAQEDEA